MTRQTDAEKKADQQAKELASTLLNLKSATQVSDEATGSEAGNIDRVQALAAAIQNTNLAYSERKNALNELRETNKAYFGDLTLEQSSLATLTKRVQDYSNALIAEAVVKKQTDAIAELTSKYLDQERALTKLKTTRDQAAAQEAIGKKNLPTNIAGEGEQAAALQQLSLHDATAKANDAFLAQRDAVEQISAQIAEYKGALDSAIQDQLKFKPLKDVAAPDELKSVIPVLEQIKKIQDEMAKPSKDPIFKQNALAHELSDPNSNAYKLFEAKIQEAFTNAITKGADDPKLAAAYRTLGETLQEQLSLLQNPDQKAHFAFQTADIDDKEVKQFHDDAGKQLTDYMKRLPPLKTDIQVDPNLVFQSKSVQDFNTSITKILQSTTLKGFENLGKNIGEAIAGGLSSQDFFSGFLRILGAGLAQLGEYALSIAPLITGLKTAIKTLSPAALVVGGVGLIALGKVLEHEASKSVKAFATGGIVTGPTLGLVGEAGPEVIFPLDRLNQFVKTMNPKMAHDVRVTGTIRGRDIAISSARDAKLQGMTS